MHRQTHSKCFSVTSGRNAAPLRAAMLSLMLLFGGWVEQAQAVCKWNGGVTPPSKLTAAALPASLTLKAAAIGGVLAYYDVVLSSNVTWYTCEGNEPWGMEQMAVTLPLQDATKRIYESGIPGIGIRIGFRTDSGNWSDALTPPFEYRGYPGFPVPTPSLMRVEFIRTGIAVGSGSITPFDVSTLYYMATVQQTRIPVTGTQLKTTLVNKIYFTSCYNPASAPTVNLGRPAISELRQGNTLQKDFSLTIRCDGMNQTTKPPVSIYFEGNSPRDGLLLTDGQGQAGMAQGVGVTLTNEKGVALPFSKANAMPMTWTSSGTNSEFYHFAGKARYIASGGEIKAGKADATLTYVLQYN
ncbi:fimbrial protein [Burkholderia ubonensis]|uniref:fimbrial protein n=1 Tax=Burkholderia ubonensis TaxID=101571 RepID=UPI000B1A8181|nr:fimbrial protein [Burkholderia ubonensis]